MWYFLRSPPYYIICIYVRVIHNFPYIPSNINKLLSPLNMDASVKSKEDSAVSTQSSFPCFEPSLKKQSLYCVFWFWVLAFLTVWYMIFFQKNLSRGLTVSSFLAPMSCSFIADGCGVNVSGEGMRVNPALASPAALVGNTLLRRFDEIWDQPQ